MTTVVDLCNLALSKLGDRATVTSISPPEGSAQADHCARWYPIARDVALEEFPQSFSTTRETLTPTTNPSGSWAYAYFKPNNCLRMLRLVPNAADITPGAIFSDVQFSTDLPYEVETDTNGREIILTNEPNAVLLFTTRVVDPGRFSSLFADALVFLLASYLSGPVLKGKTGEAAAKANYNAYVALIGKAAANNASQTNHKREYVPQGMAARGVAFGRNRRVGY